MRTRKLALLDAALLVPAVFFLGSVVLHVWHLWPDGAGHFASQVVAWYAARKWTLWLLLLALPMIALGTGCAQLFSGRTPVGARHAVPAASGGYFLGAATATAGVILTIVVLHMLAN